MGDISTELQFQLEPLLRAGDLAQCERILNGVLMAMPESPCHVILDLFITTNPEGFAACFDDFFRKEASRFPIAAAYTELDVSHNDFWSCSIFAYQSYHGHNDYNWLCDFQSEDSNRIVIQGLDPLQKIYPDAIRHPIGRPALDIVELLVVVKFQDLIRRAAPFMKELRFQLLSTVHDYEFIYEFKPSPRL